MGCAGRTPGARAFCKTCSGLGWRCWSRRWISWRDCRASCCCEVLSFRHGMRWQDTGGESFLQNLQRFGLARLEPPLDLLARLPRELLLRSVEFSTWDALAGHRGRELFAKPAAVWVGAAGAAVGSPGATAARAVAAKC